MYPRSTVLTRLLCLALLVTTNIGLLQAQTLREITTYYDKYNKQVMERYTVIGNDSSRISGQYFKFFRNGKTAVRGQFKDGEKDGVFKSYYPSGDLQQTLTFENGLKMGPVMVYAEGGQLIQSGQFELDTLADTLTLYYPTGNLKSITTFKKGRPDGTLTEY